MVVPIESRDWISGSAMAQAQEICAGNGVEIAFPKPFCDFKPEEGTLLADFRRRFGIGSPEVELTVEGNTIKAAHVIVSAPCGSTWYVARWLVGRSVQDDLRHDVVARRLHSYPCTGSMAWDDELADTILHVAGENHYRILEQLEAQEGTVPLSDKRGLSPLAVTTPLGKTLPPPIPLAENLQNIEAAKAAILDALRESGELRVAGLRRLPHSPAAASTALAILKKDGRVQVEDGVIRIP